MRLSCEGKSGYEELIIIYLETTEKKSQSINVLPEHAHHAIWARLSGCVYHMNISIPTSTPKNGDSFQILTMGRAGGGRGMASPIAFCSASLHPI